MSPSAGGGGGRREGDRGRRGWSPCPFGGLGFLSPPGPPSTAAHSSCSPLGLPRAPSETSPQGPPPQGPSQWTHPCLQTEAPTLDMAGLSAGGVQWGNPDTEGDRTPPPRWAPGCPPRHPPPVSKDSGSLGQDAVGTDLKSHLLSHSESSPYNGSQGFLFTKLSPRLPGLLPHLAESVTSGPVFTASQVPLEGGLSSASGPPGPQPCFWLRMELMG